jgi:hypothetical protein
VPRPYLSPPIKCSVSGLWAEGAFDEWLFADGVACCGAALGCASERQCRHLGLHLSGPASGWPFGGEGGWTGKVVIDESALPGGTLSGARLSFSWTNNSSIDKTKDFGISNASGFSAGFHEASLDFTTVPISSTSLSRDWSAYGILPGAHYNGVFDFAGSVGHGFFRLTFDENKTIVAWSGNNMLGSFDNDPYTTNGIDSRGFRQSIGPGTWSGPAAVPVPAALPLFAIGLGLLGWLGFRRKRRAALAA